MAIVTTQNLAPAVELPVTGVDPAQAAQAALVQQVAPVVAAANVQAAAAAPVVEVVQPAVETPETAAAPAPEVAPQDTGATAPTTEPGPVVELTPSEKLAAKIEAKKAQAVRLQAEIEKLEQQYRSADLLDKVAAGSVIKARVGRADTAREVTASVVGIQTLDNGDRRIKIYFGEGFDAETVVIQDSQIIDVVQV